jgi:hypothetical protein
MAKKDKRPIHDNDKVSEHGKTDPPGTSNKRTGQTNGQYEQDVDRRAGGYTGAGEAPFRQPGRRQ